MIAVTRSGRARMSFRSAISGEDLLVLGDDLVALEPGEPLEAHLEDRLRLDLVEAQEARPRGARAAERSSAVEAEEPLERAVLDGDLRREPRLRLARGPSRPG